MRLDPDIAAFLDQPRYATISTLDPDGKPWQHLIGYIRDGETILFATGASSKKGRNIAHDGRVSLCVVDGFRYVSLRGVARAVAGPGESERVSDAIATRYFGPTGRARFGRSLLGEDSTIYAVDIADAFGIGIGPAPRGSRPATI